MNLSTDKHEDNIAKCLTKGDITKLASKAQTSKAQCGAEKILRDALEIVKILGTSREDFQSDDAMQPLGQIFVRVGLSATGKGKLGPEGKDHTMPQIQQMFLDAMSHIVNTKVNFPSWNLGSEAADVKQPEELRNTQPLKQFTRLLQFQEAQVPKRSYLRIGKADTDKPAKKTRKS